MNNCDHLYMTFRGWGTRTGEKIALVTCLDQCGEKFQITTSGVMYQVKRPSPVPVKSIHVSARITTVRKREILKKWGSFQAFADKG